MGWSAFEIFMSFRKDGRQRQLNVTSCKSLITLREGCQEAERRRMGAIQKAGTCTLASGRELCAQRWHGQPVLKLAETSIMPLAWSKC